MNKSFSFKTTLNRITNNKTYFINGKKVKKQHYDLMDMMCKRQDCFSSYTKGDYLYSFKSGSYF